MEAAELQEVKTIRERPRFIDKLWVRTRIGEKGRLVIPSALREALGMAEGDLLDMRVVDGELRIATMRQRLRRAQEHVRKYVPAGVSLSEELSAERREAARRE